MSHSARRALVLISAVSGLYDIVVGAVLLLATDRMAGWFGVPPPSPAIHANLNALFLLAVGAGYVLPFRDPDRYRGYLWLMGPCLKGAGAMLFITDYFVRHSPPSFLLFAASDGALALITAWALVRTRPALKPGPTIISGDSAGR